MRKLFTIGYIGLTLDVFIDGLLSHGIECLIDTREIPISRKKGFSKTSLEAELGRFGITYRHFRLLGSPRLHRNNLRETGDYNRFFTEVARHFASTEANEAVKEAISLAHSMCSCLMCCCPDWHYCHRKLSSRRSTD
jgi:uncharacterized protein (DUF488 family)